ncbi:hypothetical protein KQX54_013087 [Cotesia glomerata]|uniref:Uncharacterized protein n=1 Tax=Cotesia glomerata TaxID=32391 RepID=A0AAV7IAD3_COTGL|nr:hypothetical protein KQX54_013087 [Cotesia glomerata]
MTDQTQISGQQDKIPSEDEINKDLPIDSNNKLYRRTGADIKPARVDQVFLGPWISKYREIKINKEPQALVHETSRSATTKHFLN